MAKQDLAENQIKWLDPSTANNTYAIAVKTTVANQLNVKSLSDYAKLANNDPSKASVCIASEFAGRSDGWPGLQKSYGFTLPESSVATLAEGAIYDAIGKGEPCDFGEVATTDGRIKALGLTPVPDDKAFFPVYNPAVTINKKVLDKNPGIAKVLNPIAKALDTDLMQRLNSDVDITGQRPPETAQKWLKSKGFIGCPC